VALKVIRGGAHVDEHHIKLFQREVQTLAKLRHPGIATIFDSGVTEDGQHFFAMELVRGQTLSEYARQHEAVRDRLAVFLKICQAVAYAHQRGVIHRDLKPTNILVEVPRTPSGSGSLPGTGAEVKVLDFGLARLVDTEGSLSSMLSEVGTIRGTLPYMSPEQVRGHTDQIDVRTDVYALGVILYELLTGRLPYDLTKAGLPELARIITEEPPAPLSRSFSGTRRPGADLSTILFKALEKEPGRRYGSAAALAEDVERYLSDQPILARPPSAAYQARKLVSRHRYLFGSIAVAFVALVGFAVTMAVQAGRIASERDRANREAAAAQQVSSFLEGLFRVADPSESRGNMITAREILDQGAERIERELEGQPTNQARLMGSIGRVYQGLGLYERAEALHRRSLAIREANLGEDSPEVAETLNDLGYSLMSAGNAKAALPLHRQALAICEHRLAPGDARIGLSHYWVGVSLMRLGENRAAVKEIDTARGILEAALGPDSQQVAWCENDLGVVYESLLDYEAARRHYENALRLKERALSADHPDIVITRVNLGYALVKTGRFGEARLTLDRGLADAERILGPEHPVTSWAVFSLGELARSQGDLPGAESSLRRALAIQERTLDPSDAGLLALTLHALACCLRDQRRDTEAEVLFTRAIRLRESALGRENPQTLETAGEYAKLLRRMGRTAEAEALEALVRDTAPPPGSP